MLRNISSNYSNIQLKALARDVHKASLDNVKTYGRANNSIKESGGETPNRNSLSKPGALASWKPWNGKTNLNGSSGHACLESKQETKARENVTDPGLAELKARNDQERLNAEAVATMMAENMKTQSNIAKIYDEMWAEMQKNQASRHKILMDTMNFVSEIMAKCHQSRSASFEAHSKSFLEAIIDAPKH